MIKKRPVTMKVKVAKTEPVGIPARVLAALTGINEAAAAAKAKVEAVCDGLDAIKAALDGEDMPAAVKAAQGALAGACEAAVVALEAAESTVAGLNVVINSKPEAIQDTAADKEAAVLIINGDEAAEKAAKDELAKQGRAVTSSRRNGNRVKIWHVKK